MATLKFIALICLTLMIVKTAAPIQFIKDFLKVGGDSEPKDLTRRVLRSLLGCALCTGFWVFLFGYQNFYYAFIGSFASELFCRLWNKITLHI